MKLLWVGDAACDSGFARCTHETLKGFKSWDITVLGINYQGDPHEHPYRIFPALIPRGDLFGVSRIGDMIRRVRPDVIVLQNDPWNIPAYAEAIAAASEALDADPPLVVGSIAVDGKHCMGKSLNKLDHAIFWTQFGADEAVKGGYEGTYSIIPLGVDTDVFYPGDRDAAWQVLQLPEITRDGFYFLNVNRNQPRKHLELTLEVFARFLEWWNRSKPGPHPYLYMHVCPTGENAVNVDRVGGHYDLGGHLILAEPGVSVGASEKELVATYRLADVMLTTTQGEGWGLPTIEGMACGVPQIVPNWSALGEWATAAWQVPCTQHHPSTPMVAVIGGLPDLDEMLHAMQELYLKSASRDRLRVEGLKLVNQDRFRWSNIARRFEEEVTAAYGRLTRSRREGAIRLGEVEGLRGDGEEAPQPAEEVSARSSESAVPGDGDRSEGVEASVPR